jgi:hypothetical protein
MNNFSSLISRIFREMTDSRARAGKVQNEPGILCCPQNMEMHKKDRNI